MVGFACGDVTSATFPTTVSKPKMIDTSEQTIALVVDSDDNLSKDDAASGSSTYRDTRCCLRLSAGACARLDLLVTTPST